MLVFAVILFPSVSGLSLGWRTILPHENPLNLQAHTINTAFHASMPAGLPRGIRGLGPRTQQFSLYNSFQNGPGRFEQTADLRAANEEECVLHIDNESYNLTAWAKAHPGGVSVLRKYHNKDASKAFHAVGHSSAAYTMLKDFAIAQVPTEQGEEIVAPTTHVKPRWRQKLFTKEDPIGFHKYLGFFCLFHFALRFVQMYFGDPSAGFGTRLGKGAHIGPVLCLIPHALLSMSSLIFHTVPRERVVGRPMIWREYRVHNIVFGLRSVACTFFAWLSCYKGHSPPWRRAAIIGSCLAAFLTSVVADDATRRLRTNPNESTTATMPYWEGCSKQTELRFKTFYAFSQFMATIANIALLNPVWPFATLFAIQVASLLMTLVRKGFLSTKGSHMVYTISLVMPYLAGLRSMLFIKPWDLPLLLAIAGVLFQLRRQGVNKYIIWIPIYAARVLFGDRFIPYQVW